MVHTSVLRRLRTESAESSTRRIDDLRSGLRGEGLVAVPQKPTTEMIIAGSRAGDISPSQVTAIYQAMLRVAEEAA